ncbi:hypothetical protein ACJW31_04G046200 [Castanea mollissima]
MEQEFNLRLFLNIAVDCYDTVLSTWIGIHNLICPRLLPNRIYDFPTLANNTLSHSCHSFYKQPLHHSPFHLCHSSVSSNSYPHHSPPAHDIVSQSHAFF